MTEVRPIDISPKGIEQTCELLNVVYPHAAHYDTTYLERLFNQNPVGPTLGFSAFDGDELVAHYLMLPIKARVFGEEEIGIWPFQLATRPGFRGKGLFSELNERCFEASRERLPKPGFHIPPRIFTALLPHSNPFTARPVFPHRIAALPLVARNDKSGPHLHQ